MSSAQNGREFRTAVLLRQEMRRWRQLQLEPTSLRESDPLTADPAITASGAHVPAALYHLAEASGDPQRVYAEVANRLAEVVAGVDQVRVVKDTGSKRFHLMMLDRRGTELPAASLSDGTLRFLALAVMEHDPRATGLLCLEEPENGIHPLRVESMMKLLTDMAVDPEEPVDDQNPLRQVAISTHSPVVVGVARDDDILFARPRSHRLPREDEGDGDDDGKETTAPGPPSIQGVEFVGLRDTWRHRTDGRAVARGQVQVYLNAPRGQLPLYADGVG